MTSWHKAAAAALMTYFGLSWLDNKLLLLEDLGFGLKMKKLLQFSQGKAGTHFTVTDAWYATLAKINARKKCLLNSATGAEYTFGEVEQLSNQVANWAISKGFQPGDTVALFMGNRPDYIITWLGLTKAGITIALINSNNKMKPLLHSLEIANCVSLIFGTEVAENVGGVLEELRAKGTSLFAFPEDPDSSTSLLPEFAPNMLAEVSNCATSRCPVERRASIKADDHFGYIYTSGTTGLPKACVISHLKYCIVGSCMEVAFGVTDKDVLYTVLPLYHSAGGMLGAGCMVMTGVSMVVAPKFSASKFWKDCTIHKITVTQYIGELCRYLLNSPPTAFDKAHRVRIAVGNGLRREIWGDFTARFGIPQIGEFYGATEGNISFFNHSIDGKGLGAVGRAGFLLKKILGFKLVEHDVATESPVRGPDGFCREVGAGEVGELLGRVKADNPISQFKGYTSKEATAKKILRDVFEKGDLYFRTGDLMRQEADGFVYFVDRIGDTFRWKGENVSTNEVSEVVSVFPGILEANVYGVKVPGNEDGRACMAAIVTADGKAPDFEKLYKHIAEQLASYAIPQFIRLLPAMESTGTFKQRKVTFVEEGVDLEKVAAAGGDPLWWLDSSDRANPRYRPYGVEESDALASGRAKL